MKIFEISRKASRIIITILLLSWLIRCSSVKEVAPGNDRFGLAFISAPDHLADERRYQGALATGARWDRWPLYWHWVDEGGYVGSHAGGRHDYDTLIAQDIAHGLTPIVILLGTPARHAKTKPDTGGANISPRDYLLSEPNALSAPAYSATLPPTNLTEPVFVDGTDVPGPGKAINPANAWAYFVFTTVERYRPQGMLARQKRWPPEVGIRYWEIWNEPDFYSFWGGTVEEYDRLLEVAYKSIKAADPDATVLMGGLAFYDQHSWLSALLGQTEGQPDRAYFDVFSFHYYSSIYESERLLRQSRATLDAYGLANIPIWITESGLPVWDDYPATASGLTPNEPQHGTMLEQAAYVIQNSTLAFYNGVERYYHFLLHDDCGSPPRVAYGLRQNFSPHVCYPAEGKPRPAYAAYQLAADQFRDLVPLWRETHSGQDRVAFYRPDDQSRLVVMWTTQDLTVTTTLTATNEIAYLHWVEPTNTLSGTTGLSHTLTLTPTNDLYALTLLPTTNDRSYQIGGLPVIVVEKDTRSPQTHIHPLPSTSPPDFELQWQGEDLGSGIAGYDVYVGQDDEPLQLWLDSTPQTEAKFSGQIDHTYRFVVRARDRAGNEEQFPASPQVTTHIITGSAVSGVVLGPGGEPVANASVVINGANTRESVVTNRDGKWLQVALRPDNYTFQAEASGYAAWPTPRRINFSHTPLTITTTLAPLTNAIAAADFEGDQVWKVWQRAGQISLSNEAFDGQAAARLGNGAEGVPTECSEGQPGQLWVLSQQVTIPDSPSPLLSFLYKVSTPQISATESWLEVLLVIEGQPYYLFTPTELQPTPDWTLAFQDLSSWQDQTVDLQFKVQSCSEQSFTVTLDRVSLGEAITQ